MESSTTEKIPCKFFAKGKCTRGDACYFSHILSSSPTENPKKQATVSTSTSNNHQQSSRVVVVEQGASSSSLPENSEPLLKPLAAHFVTNMVTSDDQETKPVVERRERNQTNRKPVNNRTQEDKQPLRNRNNDEYADSNPHTTQNPPPKNEIPRNHNKKSPRERPIKLVKVNTETFEPSYTPPDMRIVLSSPGKLYTPRDVIISPRLFCEEDEYSIYQNLLAEIESSNIPHDDLWKLWHGDTHLIADDHVAWKEKCPTFKHIIDKLKEYYQMDIKATRFNWYRDNQEWKPYHFDAAAVDPKKAKTQNMTIGVSFGALRDIAFEHATTKTRISIPLVNGMTYGFSQKVNVDWRHGVPQLPPKTTTTTTTTESSVPTGRISIIAWGYCKLIDE